MSTTNESNAAPLKRASVRRRWLTTFVVALPAVAAMAAFPACGTNRPEAGQNGVVGPGAGDPCTSGATRACHKVTGERKGYVDCFEGTQICEGGAWGICAGAGTLSTHFMPNVAFSSEPANANANAVHTLTVNPDAGTGAGTSCAADPCNPYCWSFGATPDAGPLTPIFGVPNVPPNGTAICPPSITAVGNACVNNRACFQDTHCNTVSGKCEWNIASAYVDPTCAGFDLTLNAWCSGVPATYTICNRGTLPLTTVAGATTTLAVWQSNGGPSGNSAECVAPYYAPAGAATYSGTLAASLAPGACTTIDSAGVNGNRHTFLYATRALSTSTTSGNLVTPIAYTTTVNHGLKTGDVISVTGITGNTNANVTNKAIVVSGLNTFTVAGVTGNGAYGGAGAIRASLTECNAAANGGCFNNESSAKDNGGCGACGPGGGTTAVILTSPYHAICPVPDTHPEWTYLLYNVTASVGGDAKFEMRTAPDVAGAPGAYTAWITAADPPVAAEPWIRTHANPVGLANPVLPAVAPVGGVLGGKPATINPWMEMRITVTPSATPPSAILNSWALEYSCVPFE